MNRLLKPGFAALLVLVTPLFMFTSGLAGLSNPNPAVTARGTAAAAGPQAPEPRIAIGLSGVFDWSVQQPFIDVMKTARDWVGHRHGEWGGVESAELAERGLLDDRGWPLGVPVDLRAIGTILLTDLPAEARSLAGRYRLTFDGEGVIELGGRAQSVRYAKNEIRFDFTPGDGGVILNIKRTDPYGRGAHIRNIRIVKTDHIDRMEAGEVFNPDWVRRIDRFHAVRFMDWMATNDSTVSGWQDRPRPDDVTWTRKGVPVEVMVRLANDIGADPWFNMPHLATDAYMQAFAQHVHDRLDPALTAHVEFSNEVWNWQFEQARWAEAQGVARWGQKHSGVQFYGLRAAQMARIWRQAFDGSADTRLVTIIATQTGWLGREHDALEAPLWVAEAPATNRPPVAHFDAYAVTGYFSGLLGSEEKAPTVRGWIEESRADSAAEADRKGLTGAARTAHVDAHEYDTAVALAARELLDGSVSGDPRDTLSELFGTTLPYHRDVARRHGLQLIMYEGGTHVVGIGPVASDDGLADFFIHLNYTEEMGALYRELLQGWHRSGGGLFNVFADVYKPNRWGSWGALRHLDDENPRWDALVRFTSGDGQ